jgi:hypothetical protein
MNNFTIPLQKISFCKLLAIERLGDQKLGSRENLKSENGGIYGEKKAENTQMKISKISKMITVKKNI